MRPASPESNRSRKIALVTGGSYGLGFAFAEHLVADGYRVVILARDEMRLEEAVTKLSLGPGSASGIPCDVTDPSALQKAAERVSAGEGRVDFLIANAGSLELGLLEDHSPATALRDIKTGLFGAILTAHAFLPLLRQGSKALFIASGFGLIGAAGYAPYCAANAGIINFAEALRRECLRSGISVYAACPSDIQTPGFRKEMDTLLPWMNRAGARGKPLRPEVTASRILRKCRGHRFLIVINPEIIILQLAKRLLPERVLQLLVDRLFPMPPKGESQKDRERATPAHGSP